MGVGVGFLAIARHVPGNFYVGFVGANGELVMADLGSDDGLRELSDHGQSSGVAAEVATHSQGSRWAGLPTASRTPQLQ